MKELSHVNSDAQVEMVNVAGKQSTLRTARAYAEVHVSAQVYEAIANKFSKKGDVLTVAQIAGIQAAKKTYELIPLCHNIFISKVDLKLELAAGNMVTINSFAATNGPTGIEMEALTAVSVAALTVYDMCKALDKSIRISNIHLLEKTGGKSGDFISRATDSK